MASLLLAPPPSVPASEGKLFRIRMAYVLVAAVLHATLALVYLGFGQRLLAGLNVAATGVNGLSVLLARRGRPLPALALSLGEAFAHVALFSYLVGVGSGYVFYGFAGATAAFLLFPAREGLGRLLLVAWSATTAAAVLLALRGRLPPIALAPAQVEALFWMNAAGTAAVLVFLAWYFSSVTDRAQAEVERERARSEQLLLNILPAPIADRLKASPDAIADGFEAVSVLFADIVGFTALSRRLPPEGLVRLLSEVFSAFDELADRHGLEKIKTIGDAYMAVGGLPVARADHARAVAAMALDMLEVVGRFADRGLQVRIGVHSGPVVAGVIGRRKYSYDLWGDTVNTASRMESHGAPGAVHASQAFREAVGAGFRFEDRGLVEVKGLGPMATCWLRGRV